MQLLGRKSIHGFIGVYAFILGLFSLISPALAQDYDLQLNEVNLSTDQGLWSPSIQGRFYLLTTGTFDPTTGEVTIIPQTSPLTHVSFGITTNFPFDPSVLKFAVGLDGFTDLIPLTNLTVQNSLVGFNGTTDPIYLVQGDLSQPFVPSSGQHLLDIVDQSNAPIGLGFVGTRTPFADFEADFIAVPEPSVWVLLLGGFGLLVFRARRLVGRVNRTCTSSRFIWMLLVWATFQSQPAKADILTGTFDWTGTTNNGEILFDPASGTANFTYDTSQNYGTLTNFYPGFSHFYVWTVVRIDDEIVKLSNPSDLPSNISAPITTFEIQSR